MTFLNTMKAKKQSLSLLAVIAAAFAFSARADIQVKDPWVRPSQGPNGALFLTLVNTSRTPEKLIHAHVGGCRSVELHTHREEKGISRMIQVKAIDIPALGEQELKPGGHHIMLIHLLEPLKEGQAIPVILAFETGDTLQFVASVKASKEECCASRPPQEE